MVAITAIVVILCASIMWRAQSLLARRNALDEKADNLEAQLKTEQNRSEDLDQLALYTQTMKYVEEVAREKLGLIKPGDTTIKPQED